MAKNFLTAHAFAYGAPGGGTNVNAYTTPTGKIAKITPVGFRLNGTGVGALTINGNDFYRVQNSYGDIVAFSGSGGATTVNAPMHPFTLPAGESVGVIVHSDSTTNIEATFSIIEEDI